MNNREQKKYIAVSGIDGQLGREIQHISDSTTDCFKFLSRLDFDLTDKKKMANYFSANDFDIFLNCAAYTNVEEAESNIKIAHTINYDAVRYLAELCKSHDVVLIHISTDYVFDGELNKPYTENARCNPINVYGQSKHMGELAMQEISPNSIIIRTSWLYSSYGKNFVSSIIENATKREEIRVVDDQFGSPTFAGDLAASIIEIIKSKNYESYCKDLNVFHYCNQGYCSWYDFAREIIEIMKIDCTVLPIKTQQLNSALKRPKTIRLDTSKIRNTFNINIPDWKDSLSSHLLNRG